VPLGALLNGQATIYALVAVLGWTTTRSVPSADQRGAPLAGTAPPGTVRSS
jgi:hypothetical protein